MYCLSHLHLFLLTQTLTSLNLQHNTIGADGARHLADTLKTNTVNIIFIFSLHLHLFLITQVLTILNLEDNGIGDNGMQYLGDALKTNTVNIVFDLPLSSACIPYHTDTHHTQPRIQWNR